MQIDARNLLYRVEMRVAQMTGRELTAREVGAAADDAWAIGLIRSWKQIRRLRENGELIEFEEIDGRATDAIRVRKAAAAPRLAARANHWRDL